MRVWRRKQPVEPIIEVPPSHEAADALQAAKDLQPRVDRIVNAHRLIRRENHLGPRVRRALIGGDDS